MTWCQLQETGKEPKISVKSVLFQGSQKVLRSTFFGGRVCHATKAGIEYKDKYKWIVQNTSSYIATVEWWNM